MKGNNDTLEFSVSLGGSRTSEPPMRCAAASDPANDNADRDQEMFEQSVARELVEDEIIGPAG